MTAAAARGRGADLPGGRTVVRLRGDLGISAAPALRERLISVLRPRTRRLVLDLSRVQSCDPVGLAVLVAAQRRAKLHGIDVRLVAPSRPVAELLHSTGLERCFTLYPDLPSALAWESGDLAAAEAVIPQALAS